MKSLAAAVLMITVVGCKQEQPPKPIVPEVAQTSEGYEPIEGDRDAYNFVMSHKCEHRHHPTEWIWDSSIKRLVPSPAFNAYDCEGVGNSIFITEAPGGRP